MSEKGLDLGSNEKSANAAAIAKVKINRPATSTVSRAAETQPLAERIARLAAQAKATEISMSASGCSTDAAPASSGMSRSPLDPACA